MTKLEEIARAIWEARRAYVAKEWPEIAPLEKWGDGSLAQSNGVLEEARAAIEAMREPNEAMAKAAYALHEGDMFWNHVICPPVLMRKLGVPSPKDDYRAMIDAILNEKAHNAPGIDKVPEK